MNLRLFIYTFIDRIDVIKKIFALSKKELKAISGYSKDNRLESDELSNIELGNLLDLKYFKKSYIMEN